MQINDPTINKGPGYWRFDNTLLTDNQFLQEMRNHINSALNEDLENPMLLWEWTKYKIREFCIAFAVKRKRQNKATEKRLQFLAERHDLSDSPDTASEVQSIKRELAEILQEKANKTIFRAKAHWTQLGEKPSAYFLGLEKRQSRNKCITALKNDSGTILTDPAEILAFEKKYFSEIYQEDPAQLRPVEDIKTDRYQLPQVTESHKNLISLPFTPRDFYDALKDLNTNKTPGSDGITPEFYKKFWDLLQNTFYDSMMFSLDQGHLSQEQRTGIVTLIPKKAEDRLSLNNWRPITLLNTDFKIFSKALANRLQCCIKDVVSPDQTGFIKGRTIGSNITTIQSVIDHAQTSSEPGLLLSVDYRKAFDTIRWELIYYALSTFGFGEQILSAVKLLFHDIRTCVLNHGFSSGFFQPSRGIRQGCCCSPSLFVIAVEFLAILVRQSTEIRGITIAGRQYIVSQYADDATFFISNFNSLTSLLTLLTSFAAVSGLHINCHKSHLLLLGHHLDPPSAYGGINISDQVTILGITFRFKRTEAQHYSSNFEAKLNKIKSICSTWMNRSLSLKGKVLLISSLMASILQYPCANTTTPTRVIVEFKKIICDFFWNEKKGKVAYNVLIQDIAEGGLKLPDLTTRIRTSHLYWIKHFWEHPESTMAAIMENILNSGNVQELLECKSHLASRIDPNYSFLREILKTWAKLHVIEPTEEADIQKEMLWNNSYINIQLKPVCWPRWRDAGILRINDLIHDSQPRFLSHTELAQKFGIHISFLELLQMRSAIPCLWKRKLTGQAQDNLTVKPTIYNAEKEPIPIVGKSSKTLYYTLVKFLKPNITSQIRWNEVFPIGDLERQDYWKDIYKIPYISARDTKLQAFHFRVVHRFLPCNRFLKNIRIIDNDTCSFCNDSDTIEHFLFKCPAVKSFWRQVTAWFERESDINLTVSLRTFLFGIPTKAPQSKVINFLLLFSKFFIYRQKLFHKGSLELTHFLRDLRMRLRVEKYLTTLEGKRQKFHKWQKIYSALG